MLDKSFFASEAVQAKDVPLGDGKLHTLHFRAYSGAAFNAYAHAVKSADPVANGKGMAILIADCLCNKDGERQLTVEQASRLNPAPMQAIFKAVLEANGLGADDKNEQDDPGNT
ncbi:hypothetical protein [Achromobacter sp. CSND-B12]|uniref:hypothetical protein n=1 Tax=Achromobacter sp. CSND-B12 TaxID=3462570 RepID=UPI00406A26BA